MVEQIYTAQSRPRRAARTTVVAAKSDMNPVFVAAKNTPASVAARRCRSRPLIDFFSSPMPRRHPPPNGTPALFKLLPPPLAGLILPEGNPIIESDGTALAPLVLGPAPPPGSGCFNEPEYRHAAASAQIGGHIQSLKKLASYDLALITAVMWLLLLAVGKCARVWSRAHTARTARLRRARTHPNTRKTKGPPSI